MEENARFCTKCGEKLTLACPACGVEASLSDKFCHDCGSKIPLPHESESQSRPLTDYTPRHLADEILGSRSALEGERKQVTVLFADVKHSTEIASALDIEDWHGVLDGFFQVLSREVHRFEGTVNQYTGDGIMALFGAPVAHEDHARRACLSALCILDAAHRYGDRIRRRYDVDFEVRLGINSGEVVVGRIGDDLRMDYTAQGPVVHLAARAQGLAEAGAAWVAPATVEQVGMYFRFDDVGEREVKGIEAPVHFQRLAGRGDATTRFDIARERGLAPFIGRDHEMQLLEDALLQSSRGNGQVIGISAEPGVGKSRLSFEFMSRCRERGLRFLYGICLPHGRSLAFHPILQVLRDYYGIAADEAADEARRKIAARMLAIDDSFADGLPLICEFLGVADPELPPPQMPPEAKQRRLFLMLREALKRGPEPGQPVGIVVIEDLHWIDPGSDEWVSQWVEFTAGAASMLVVNFRPEYQPKWVHRSHCQKMALAPLSADGIRSVVTARVGDHASLSRLVNRIQDVSGGNPFYAEEIVRSLIESGALGLRDGNYALAGSLEHIEIPKTVQSVLAARIDRLPDAEKHVLQSASVIGKRFDEDLLVEATRLGTEATGPALEMLCANEFLQQDGYYPVATYSFRHPLTQQVTYDSLLRDSRRTVHAAVARAIHDRSQDLGEDAALLAHHFHNAGDQASAAQWHMTAAERIGISDVNAALDHAAAVLDGLGSDDVPAEVAPLLAGAAAKVLALTVRTGIRRDIDLVYEQGKRWAQAAKDPVVEAILAGAYAGCLAVDGQIEASFRAGKAFEDIAAQIGIPELLQVATAWTAFPCWRTGRFIEAEQRLDQALAHATQNPELGKIFYGYGMVGLFLYWRAEIYMRTRHWSDVECAIDDTFDWVREHNEVEYHIYVLWLQAERLRFFGANPEAVIRQLREGLTMAEEWGAAWPLTIARLGLADGLVQTGGDGAEALSLMELALHDVRKRRIARHFEGEILAVMAQAQGALGRSAEALRMAVEAVEKSRQIPLSLAKALISLVKVSIGIQELDRCRDALDQLTELVGSLGASNYEPLLAWLKADFAAACERTAETRALLQNAHQGFLNGGAQIHARTVERVMLRK